MGSNCHPDTDKMVVKSTQQAIPLPSERKNRLFHSHANENQRRNHFISENQRRPTDEPL